MICSISCSGTFRVNQWDISYGAKLQNPSTGWTELFTKCLWLVGSAWATAAVKSIPDWQIGKKMRNFHPQQSDKLTTIYITALWVTESWVTLGLRIFIWMGEFWKKIPHSCHEEGISPEKTKTVFVNMFISVLKLDIWTCFWIQPQVAIRRTVVLGF